MTPLVSCICPTTESRKGFLPTAIRSFLDQDYPEKQMVILADGPWVHELIPAGDRRFLEKWIDDSEVPLGMKRNLACGEAHSEFICHFDDDDWSAPHRISDQVKRLQESGKAITGYNPMVIHETRKVQKWDGTNWQDTSEWWRLENPITIGASFCYRRDWWEAHPFPDEQYGEDDVFWLAAAALDQTITVDSGASMYMLNHHGNVTGRVVNGGFQELSLAEVRLLFPDRV